MPANLQHLSQEPVNQPVQPATPLLSAVEALPSSEQKDLFTRLSEHVIEPELLGVYPRYPQRTSASNLVGMYFIFTWVVGLFQFGKLLFECWGKPWRMVLAVAVIASLAAFLRWISVTTARNQRKAYNLLRHGIAVPAIVTYTSLGDGTSEKADTVRLSFGYLDRLGGLISKTITITIMQFQKFKLDEGDTFTLLVSPKDELDVLPHFQLDDKFSVIPLPIAMMSRPATVNSSNTLATNLGSIEPELLGCIPRVVHWESSTQRLWKWITNICLALVPATLMSVKFALTVSPWFYIATVIFTILLCGAAIRATFLSGSLSFLRVGIPARAQIIAEKQTDYEGRLLDDKEPHLLFIYEFEAVNRKTIMGKVHVTYRRAAELGLIVGSAFTVLYNPKSPGRNKPYFLFTEAGIPGAAEPRITHP